MLVLPAAKRHSIRLRSILPDALVGARNVAADLGPDRDFPSLSGNVVCWRNRDVRRGPRGKVRFQAMAERT